MKSRPYRAQFIAYVLAMMADLAVCGAVGVVSLAVATWAYRRAAVR